MWKLRASLGGLYSSWLEPIQHWCLQTSTLTHKLGFALDVQIGFCFGFHWAIIVGD